MALYVKCISPAGQDWAGSNIAIPFDGATSVQLQAYSGLLANGDPNPATVIAAADIDWLIINSPEGTTYSQSWFVAGAYLSNTNPMTAGGLFIPDKPGTWLIRCTNTATVETVDVVIGVLQERTNIRIPAAGETNQSDTDVHSHSYPPLPSGSPAAMGWAKDRNYALELFDELISSGGLQLCYFNDGGLAGAPWNTTLKAGAAVSITGTHTLVSGDKVPLVELADGNTKQDCIGLVYCGWVAPPPVLFPGPTVATAREYPKVISTDAIPNGSLILVSRTGSVTAGAAGVIDTTVGPPTIGEVLYLSATPGILQRGTDRFALGAAATTYVVPVAMTTDQNATGTVVVIPSEYWGGTTGGAGNCSFRYMGIGDFRGARVGGTGPVVAGEMRGAIEMIATCKEAAGLVLGDVCMLYPDTAGTTNIAHRANSSLEPGNATDRMLGIVGVCVETVAFNAVGHFVIYGPAQAKLSPSAQIYSLVPYPRELFVGSSDNSLDGTCVLFEEVGSRRANKQPSVIIPVGAVVEIGGAGSPATIMVGKGSTEGYISRIRNDITFSAENRTTETTVWSGAFTPNVSTVAYTDGVSTLVPSSDLDGRDAATIVKLAGTGADDSLAEVNIFEAKLPGTALVLSSGAATTLTSLMGATSAAWSIPGAVLQSNGGNTAYATFSFDNRLRYADPTDAGGVNSLSHQNEIYLKVYGYTLGDSADMSLFTRVRFNAPSTTNLPTESGYTNLSSYPYLTELINISTTTDSVYSQEIAAATTYREFGIKCPLFDRGTWDGTSNYCDPGSQPSLGVLSPQTLTNTVTPATAAYGGIVGEFQRMLETVDIEIQNKDASHVFVVTQVVLQSRRRITGPTLSGNNSRTGYRLSYYESSYPAYAYLNYDVAAAADGVFAIDKGLALTGAPALTNDPTGEARTRGLVGTPNYVTSGGSSVLHNMYGFIPTDLRLAPGVSAKTLSFTVHGKLSCANPGTDTLGLKLELVPVVPGVDLNKQISAAAGVITLFSSIAPEAADPATGEICITQHNFVTTHTPSVNIIGYWFKVTRVDNTTGGGVNDRYQLNGTENFWLMTNVKLEDRYPNGSSLGTIEKLPEAIYEQHIPATSIIDPTSGRFTKYVNSDVSGALMTNAAGASRSAKFNTILDERYDDKSGLAVDVLFSIDNAGTAGGTLDFRLRTGYKNCQEVITAAGAAPIASEIYTEFTYPESVTDGGGIALNDIRYSKASFFIPADQVWSNPADEQPGRRYNSPDVNCSRDKGIINFLLQRLDSVAYDINVLSVVVRGMRANKTKLATVRPERIGGYSGTSGQVLTYPYTDSRRVVDVSVQRETLKFCVAPIFTQGTLETTNFGGSSGGVTTTPIALGDTNTTQLLTPYLSGLSLGSFSPRNFNNLLWGHLITRNFAVTKVWGWLGQRDVGGSGNLLPLAGGMGAGSQIRLDLYVSEVPSRSSDAGLGPGGVANTQTKIVPKRLGAATDQVGMPGVEGVPMSFFTNSAGLLDWTPDASTNGVNSTQHSRVMPKVILPRNYGSLGPARAFYPWQLCMVLTNVTGLGSGADNLYPIGEISVEIAILPSIQDANSSRNECSVGGAPSKGEGF